MTFNICNLIDGEKDMQQRVIVKLRNPRHRTSSSLFSLLLTIEGLKLPCFLASILESESREKLQFIG